MSVTRHSGVPPQRSILASTGLDLAGSRLTFVPLLPLVPVREIVADAVRNEAGAVTWVELRSEATAWSDLGEALGSTATTPADLREHLAAQGPLHLVVVLSTTLSSVVDAGLLGLLDATDALRLTVLAGGRRSLEPAALTRPDGRVVAPATLVLDADGIRSNAANLGLDLSDDEATALSRTAAALPDILPVVISGAVGGLLDQPGSRLTALEGEAAFALTSRLAIASDDEVHALLPFAVPYLLTPSAVAAADPEGRAGLSLAPAAAAGLIDRDDEAGGYRLRLALRSTVLPELERRFSDDVRRIDGVLGPRYRSDGSAIAAAVHFANAELWESAVEVLDESLFPLVALDRPGLRSLLQSLPRAVRDAHPRLMLAPEFGVTHTSGPGPASLTVGRRTAGLFSLLPAELAPLDDLIHQLARTMVARSKGDFVGALAAASELDRLLASDELASAPAATIAEAHYQVGLSRLLALDLVEARESFALAWECADSLTEPGLATGVRAAGGAALVRALEGEAVEATVWLDRLHGGTLDTAGVVAHALVAIGRLGPTQAAHWLARVGDLRPDDELWCFAVHAANRYGLYWGDPVETEAELDRMWAEHAERLTVGSTARVLLTSDAADLALLVGHLSRAEAILKTVAERNSWISASRARLELVGDSPQLALLAILEGQGRARSERYAQLDLAVLRAAAELQLGRADEAAASMLRAINQAEKSGVLVPFRLLRGETLERLARLSDDARDFVTRHELTGTSYLTPSLQPGGALSERELVVLRALDPTITVDQIAKKLFVASNTVKAQLRSIYRKLGVTSRTEALLVAAEYGLLEDAERSA